MVTWTNEYNIHRANIGSAITLVCAWQSGGYRVSVNGGAKTRTLKNLISDLDTAKTQAINLGRKILIESLSDLTIDK